MTSHPSSLSLLEALIVDNPDLERLESLLAQFNIFEALGAVRIEMRHSDFLAFLLAPNQNHGLSDLFAKRLLQRALADHLEAPIRPVELDLADLGSLLVLREWQNIDILLVDEDNRITVAIENKIGSAEHDEQLQRYRSLITGNYPAYRQVYLFLTPDGDQPTDPAYIPIDYTLVAGLVEQIVESHQNVLGPDVRTLMIHYSQMLRRHIVTESEIAELCRKIYRKHQKALDMIYEYLPDRRSQVQEILERLIAETPGMILDTTSKAYIRFALHEWDVPLLLQGQGWTRSGRMLIFEINNNPTYFKISLIIGPGPQATRQRLFDLALTNEHPLKPPFKALGKQYNTIFLRALISKSLYEDGSIEQIEEELTKKWRQFLEHDLPEIKQVIAKQAWLWESVES